MKRLGLVFVLLVSWGLLGCIGPSGLPPSGTTPDDWSGNLGYPSRQKMSFGSRPPNWSFVNPFGADISRKWAITQGFWIRNDLDRARAARAWKEIQWDDNRERVLNFREWVEAARRLADVILKYKEVF